MFFFFFFNDTATTEIYTLSPHDALPILNPLTGMIINPPNLAIWHNYPLAKEMRRLYNVNVKIDNDANAAALAEAKWGAGRDRKSTRLNSSHSQISYAVFCLKKKPTSPSVSPSPSAKDTPSTALIVPQRVTMCVRRSRTSMTADTTGLRACATCGPVCRAASR